MMGEYNFEADLKASDEVTKELLSKFESDGFKVVSTCNDNRYDFVLEKNGLKHKIEFKHDIKSSESGNIAIERESRGKASGILTTKADTILFQSGNRYFAANTVKLLQHLLYTKYSTVSGGDDGTSIMYLIPVVIFKKLNFVTEILKDGN